MSQLAFSAGNSKTILWASFVSFCLFVPRLREMPVKEAMSQLHDKDIHVQCTIPTQGRIQDI